MCARVLLLVLGFCCAMGNYAIGADARTNPKLSDKLIVGLLANTGPFAQIEDTRRCRLAMARNSRLTYDDSDEHGPDLEFMDIHRTIVELIHSVPITSHWLVAIAYLLMPLLEAEAYTLKESIQPMLERWQAFPVKKEDRRDGFLTDLHLCDEVHRAAIHRFQSRHCLA